MALPIERDSQRFRQIVHGHVRRNLRKYIADSELIGQQGKRVVSIPIPEIELPHFRFGGRVGGVGQGAGEIGTPIGRGEPSGDGNAAGDQPGLHILEVEITLEELARILGEELELPRIEPKGKKNVDGSITRYTGIRNVGPESLRHFRRTYRQALKRQLASGTYDSARPMIIPVREDKRYRSWKEYPRPHNNAVVFYLMDVSGSMTQRKKELVRQTAFWIDTWLRANYRHLTSRYIVHDAAAKEVDQHTFYHLRESGGTRISSAYELTHQIVNEEYDPVDWNLYAFHFSDGENLGHEDNQRCLKLVQEDLLPKFNLLCYGQVLGTAGHLFIDTLGEIHDDKLVMASLKDSDDILNAIKAFLGKGY